MLLSLLEYAYLAFIDFLLIFIHLILVVIVVVVGVGLVVGERVEQARHFQVCSIENRYMYMCVS